MVELKPIILVEDIKLYAQLDKDSDKISVVFNLDDPLERVDFSEVKIKPQRKGDLWKETCFELFWSLPRSEKYWELNVATTGDWNVYQFDSYRNPPYPNLKEEALVKDVRSIISRKEIKIDIPIKDFNFQESVLEFSITAVLRLKDGQNTYWAYIHRGEKPDFHIRESFILQR